VRIYVYYVGKARSTEANRLAEEYLKRAGRYARCEMQEVKPGKADLFAKHAAALQVCLDPAGKPMTSAQFTALVASAEREARDIVFVVGGAGGLPEEWRRRAGLLLSLSALTFPHELARVVLAEQIYRAFATLRGHPYPR